VLHTSSMQRLPSSAPVHLRLSVLWGMWSPITSMFKCHPDLSMHSALLHFDTLHIFVFLFLLIYCV